MSRAAWESQLAGLSSWSVKSSNNKNMTVFYIWDFITSWEVNSPFPLGCSLLRNVYVLAFGSNSPSFLCLCKVQCPKQNAQAYFFCWPSLHIYTITGSSPTGRKMFVCAISPWLLESHLHRLQHSSCHSFSPGKHAWKFSDGLIHSDLRGFFLGGFSPSFTIPMDRGSNWGFPIRKRKKCQITFI